MVSESLSYIWWVNHSATYGQRMSWDWERDRFQGRFRDRSQLFMVPMIGPGPSPDNFWSRWLVPVPFKFWSGLFLVIRLDSPGPWSWSRSRHISGPSLSPGPGPIIFLVPAFVPFPVNNFGHITQCLWCVNHSVTYGEWITQLFLLGESLSYDWQQFEVSIQRTIDT